MVSMGWTPKRDGGAGSADGSATPPRRRRRTAVVAAGDEEEFPRVTAAQARSPKASTDTRPRGGTNTANYPERGEDPRPRSVRIRPGKRWSEIILSIKAGEQTWAQFVEGLDEEELARGQLRDSNGGFMGRPPSFVPREFHLACQREMKRRFEEIFGSEVLGIARQYVQLAQDKEIPAKDRAKMMQYAMERIFGGIPKEFKVSQEAPWEQMVVNVMSGDDPEMPGHLARRYAGYRERSGDTSGE
jgi:hypothetical protein